MHWRTKARIQNLIAKLPSSLSYEVYYQVQRRFGGLQKATDPLKGLKAGIATWTHIQNQGFDPADKFFFEIGTGRVPLVPLVYWLLGARGTTTIDLNPYVRKELVEETLTYLYNNRDTVRELFGPSLREDRLDALKTFIRKEPYSLDKFLSLASITYIAPGDARDTKLPAKSVNFHTSYSVLQHIPPATLRQVMEEGNRVVTDDGLFVHLLDYTDQFAHSDPSISTMNFLQFSEQEWQRYAGNRYMYINRLRHDDYVKLFQSLGHQILATETKSRLELKDVLHSSDFQLDQNFQSKSEDVLMMTSAWFVTQKEETNEPHYRDSES